MAALGQNITVFDRDKINVRFVITDNETSLSSGYAWWGVGDDAADTGTLRFEKTNAAWNASSPAQPQTPGNLTPNIDIGASTIDCYLTRSDFGSTITAQEDLYHELVYSGFGRGTQSTVVAVGNFTIRPSMFTLKGYR